MSIGSISHVKTAETFVSPRPGARVRLIAQVLDGQPDDAGSALEYFRNQGQIMETLLRLLVDIQNRAVSQPGVCAVSESEARQIHDLRREIAYKYGIVV